LKRLIVASSTFIICLLVATRARPSSFSLLLRKRARSRRGRLNIALRAGPAKRRIVVDAGGAQSAVRVGCVPSKALLESSERSEEVRTRLATHGVECGDVRLNVTAMMAFKRKVVAGLAQGIDFLLSWARKAVRGSWPRGRVQVRTADATQRLGILGVPE
jgi:hypothetical protein